MDVLFHEKLQKAKISTSKGKLNFLQCQRRDQSRCWFRNSGTEIECECYAKNIL